MATRRSSASRRTSADDRSPRSSRDGKTQVFCPNCGTAFKIPPDNLEMRVKCTQCSRLFVAKTSTKPPSKERDKQMYWLLAVGVLILASVGIGIKMSTGDSKAAETKPVAAPTKPVIDDKNPRVADVKKWFDAMSEGNGFVVEQMSSLDRLKVQLGIAPEKILGNLPEAEKSALKLQIVDKLTKGPETALFREVEWGGGELGSEAMVNSSAGEVYASLNPRDEKKYRTGGRIKIDYEVVGGKAVVGGWTLVVKPEEKSEVKKAAGAGAPHKQLKEIGEIKQVQREINGQMKTVEEAEIVPLPHLDDTPEPLRQEIDTLIGQFCGIELGARERNKVRARLVEIGRPAIPRLLTKFSEVTGKNQDEITTLHQVVRLLSDMTGTGFSYNPEDSPKGAEQRLSTLKRYYAWWAQNHDRGFAKPKLDAEDEGTFGRAKPSSPKIPSGNPASHPASK